MDFKVKKYNGVETFKCKRKLYATIERIYQMRFECRCAFHNGSCLFWVYETYNEALQHTLDYLRGIANGAATFNGRIDYSENMN